MRKGWGFEFCIAGVVLAFTAVSVVKGDEALISLDAPWKKTVSAFADAHLRHSAWGVGHSKRNYLLALDLAEKAGLAVDRDVLFAAAFLHDMGGFPEFAKKGVDHAVRSAELVEGILLPAGFPAEKLTAVKGTILAHTYYNPVAPVTAEETVFRDADVLDFLGVVGFTRLVSVTTREDFAPELAGALGLFRKLGETLPEKLITAPAREMGGQRVREAGTLLATLLGESFQGKAL